MTILLTLAVAFAAFCVGLTVRIINRRERWATWTAWGLAVVIGYPLSAKPYVWIYDGLGGPKRMDRPAGVIYSPLLLVEPYGRQWMLGPEPPKSHCPFEA